MREFSAMTNHGCFLGTHEPGLMNPHEPETGPFQPAFFIEAIFENQVVSSDFQDVMVRIDELGLPREKKIHPQGLTGRPLKIGRNKPKKGSRIVFQA